MNTDIWFPFYYGDYLKDTMQLSAERHGVYLLLMIHCWQNGHIENDLESISIISKVDINNNSPSYILDKYFILNDGNYTHKRITKEKKTAEINKVKRSDKARKAATARWNNDATSNAMSKPTSNATRYAKAMPESCPSSSSSSSSLPIQSSTPTNNKEGDKSPKPKKHKHGEYNHVLLTEDQHKKLEEDYPVICHSMIINLDEYIETTGKSYKNHNLVMRKWEKNNPSKQPEQKKIRTSKEICDDMAKGIF